MNDSETTEEKDNVLKCPECGSTHLRVSLGELICQECGTVLQENLPDESANQRAYTQEQREKIERTGAPVTYSKADRGFSTKLGSGGNMRTVSPRKKGQYYRLRKWQRRLDESQQRRLKFALREMTRLVNSMNLPESLIEEGSRLYEKALEKNIVKGRRIEHLVAALVYILARDRGVPRTMSEISEETGISERDLGKNYRYLARELDLRVLPVDPKDFIPRFSNELGFSGETQARAREIISEAQEKGILAGRSPDSIAAAALYLASELEGEEVTKKSVAETVGVTPVTLRKGLTNLREGLDYPEE